MIGHNRTRGRSRRASRRCFLGEVSSRAVRVYYRSYRGPTSRCARYAERGLSRGRHAYEIFPSLMDHTGLRFPPLRPSSYPKFPRKRRLLAERIGRSSLARSTSTLLVQYIASRSRVLSPYSYTARASASRRCATSRPVSVTRGRSDGENCGTIFLRERRKRKTRIALSATAVRSEGTRDKTGMTNYAPVTLVYRSHTSRIRPRNRAAIRQDSDPSPNAILIRPVIGQSLSLYLRPILLRRRDLRSYLTGLLMPKIRRCER